MAADTVNLQKSYAKLNEALAKQFDESGVRRSFTVPYIDGQQMSDHVAAVGQAANDSGGLTNNLLTTAHHSGGKGWGSGDGHTVGHPSEGLRNTIIPKDDEHAKATVAAAQTHLNNLGKLLGDDDPVIKTAKSQLGLVKRNEGAGMTLLDFGVMITQIMYNPMQAVAKAHSGTKEGGHAPQLRAPGGAGAGQPQEAAGGQPGEAQPQESAQGAPPAAGEQPAAPEAQAAPAGGPSAAPAQG